MQNEKNVNIRIAKNAVFLYFRTFVVIVVSLYVSRLVLQLLGETDLGIYNVVGGVVAFLAFFQATLTKSTSRFLTYELGINSDEEKLNSSFSTCLLTHLMLVFLIIILGETIGLWLVNNIIDIPESKLFAANLVYQFSIAVFCVHVLRVPYDAVIIAHENMSVYAYVSIIEALLQLILVKILFLQPWNGLICYSIMIFVIAVLLFAIYFFYVKKKYPVYHFSRAISKDYLKKMLSFSWWTLLGSASNTATQQGVNILFNNFVGLVANAALGLSNQVNSALQKFVGSFTTAFNPQLIKLCAQEDASALQLLVNRASKFSFCLAFAFAFPLILNIDFILKIWLTNVPQYTADFCRLILICTIIDATTSPFNMVITASGKIKRYQIAISFVFLCDLLCSFVLLKLKFHPSMVFGSRIATRGFVNMLVGFYYSRKEAHINIMSYLKKTLCPVVLTLLIILPFFVMFDIFGLGLQKLVVSTVFSTVLLIFCMYFIIIDNVEKKSIIELIRKKIKRVHR